VSRHIMVNPSGLAEPSGFSYGAVSSGGRTMNLSGITGHHGDGTISGSLVEQFETACQTIAAVLAEAGGEPGDVVSVTIYTTDMAGYRSSLGPLGGAWRSVFGKHYPPMALIGVQNLLDPKAMVELVTVAVIPDGDRPTSRRG